MEGQDVQPASEPQKVRKPNPKRQSNPAVDAQRGVQGQQPSTHKSNRGRGAPSQHPQPQPQVANWGYHEGEEYANPAQYYPEDYGYGTAAEHYHQGYDYSYGPDARHGYDYGQGHGYTNDGYGPNAAHGYGDGQEAFYGPDAYGQDHGYAYGAGYGHGGVEGYGYVGADAYTDPNYATAAPAPTQPAKGKSRKSRKPKAVAAGGEYYGAGSENQGDGSGHQTQGGYAVGSADGYAYPEAHNPYREGHNAVVPYEQQPSADPPKREAKHRKSKPSRTKSMESGAPGDDESSVASRGLSVDPDGAGSARSSGSGRSRPDRSDRSVNADGIRHHRSRNRLESEGSTARGVRDHVEEGSGHSNPERRKPKLENADGAEGSANPEASALDAHIHGAKLALDSEGSTPRSAGDPREEGSGRSNPERRKQKLEHAAEVAEGRVEPAKSSNPEANALNQHIRKMGGGKPAVPDMSLAVFHPHDQTMVVAGKPQARSTLNDWVKQDQQAGPKFRPDESMIVFDDHDKSELETHMFGAPLPPTKQESIKLPPVMEQSWDTPQYQPQAREMPQLHQASDQPLYQPSRQRRSYANASSPLPHANKESQPVDAGTIQEYRPKPKKQNNEDQGALQKPQPSAKCMACVHGVGVPLARLGTRFVFTQSRKCATSCTIL